MKDRVSPKKSMSPLKKKEKSMLSPKKSSLKKRLSPKKSSIKKRMSLKSPSIKKRMSPKKSSIKKRMSLKKKLSPKKRVVSSQYKMRGMGILLNMYGGAGEALEKEVADYKTELVEIEEKKDKETDPIKREKLDKMIKEKRDCIYLGKQKMKKLLRGISETTNKAASALSDGLRKK